MPYRYTIILGHGIREDESTTFGQAVLGKAVLDRRIRLIPAVFQDNRACWPLRTMPSLEPDAMLDPQIDPERRKMVLTSQIIVAALVAGCLFFLLIVLLIVPGKLGSWDLGLGKPMTCVALVVAFGILAARIIVPGVVTARCYGSLPSESPRNPTGKTCLACIRRP